MEYIRINEHSKTPKYKQIATSIQEAAASGILEVNEKLPSVNSLLIHFDISRDTVVKAYEHLKELGVVESVPGKGYYIIDTNIRPKAKVFLLFNKLSPHKKIIYDSFSSTLGDQATIDFFIYHNNYALFKRWVQEAINKPYTHYVIIAHFLEGGNDAPELINCIPKEKLILLDKKIPGIHGNYSAIYQDFGRDIQSALIKALPRLEKYNKLHLIFPDYGYHPLEIQKGFVSFCTEYAFDHEVIGNIKEAVIQAGAVYINLLEDDLVTLIKKIKRADFRPGDEVGIISYNETPLKEILLNGITVISTDFENLGRQAANFILENRVGHLANPFYLLLRSSL